MVKPITVSDFMRMKNDITLVDVRTPAEYAHGHVPGAQNLPLFSNEERVVVGTTYKQVGREQAILLGFDLAGPKWSGFIREALEMAPNMKIAVHCWRGGMRSGAMAWALDLYGFEVYVIEGGYKRYRNWVRRWFEKNYIFCVLGGMTGSGKTKILQELAAAGEQVIDLEHLAQHQGSSYGTMNKLVQPGQEQFENDFAEVVSGLDLSRKVWVEDESRNIGKILLPTPFWSRLEKGMLIHLEVALPQRVAALAAEYGKLDKDFLAACTGRIHKRLGPVRTREALAAIEEDRMEDFVELVLFYYDKSYRASIAKRSPGTVFTLEISGTDVSENANLVRNLALSITWNNLE